MSAFAPDRERRLVPRWRFSDVPIVSPEFSSDPRRVRDSTLSKSFLDEKLFDWGRSPSVGNAIDLVSCGVSGRWLDEVRKPAEYLLKRGDSLSPQANALAERAIRLSSETPQQKLETRPQLQGTTFDRTCQCVRILRLKLQRDPRNVLAWLDLARAYIILGHREKAVRSMERALFLAPNHRQVIRSAVRLFVHIEEKGRAHTLLIRNSRTRNDPWLLATEIAVANIAGRSPRYVRQGRQIVENSGLPPSHLTELQSALGTAEFYSGSDRKAKQRLRASLTDPTDNSLAQARWMRTQISGIHIESRTFDLPLGYEARTWRALEEGNWVEAHEECRNWLIDEPYSGRPATVGSYIGISLTNDFVFAEDCALAGLRADPDEETLRNNLAVALAYQGRVNDAVEHFKIISMPLSPELPSYVYVATAGLLHFRLGDIESGRAMYDKAEQFAPSSRRHRVVIFRAREEIAAGTNESDQYLKRALEYKSKNLDPDTERLQDLLKEQAKALTDNRETRFSITGKQLDIPQSNSLLASLSDLE